MIIATRRACRGALLVGALIAERGAAQSVAPALTPGRYAYVLKQVNEMQVSMLSGDNNTIVRELYFVMDVKDAGTNQLAVALTIDSVSFAAGNTSRSLIAGYTGAGWKGVLDRDGRRVRGGLVMVDGRETDSHYIAPLRWVLPLLAGGATDTVVAHISPERGPARETTVTRKFAANDGDRLAFTGDLRTKILGDTKISGREVVHKSSGTMDGSWTLGAGIIQSAHMLTRSREEYTYGSTIIVREDQATLTLTRVK